MRKFSSSLLNDLKFSASIDDVKFSANIKSFAIINISIYVIIKSDDKNFVSMQKFSANKALKFSVNEISKFFAKKMFNIVVIKSNFINTVNILISKILSIIKSSIDFDFEINTDYDFRNWTHAKVNISFSEKTLLKKNCLDTDANPALMNYKFKKIQTSNVFIRIIIIFITICDLRTDKHIINEYVIVFMIFTEKNDKNNNVRVMFRREVHIISNLKTNILMKNKIMSSKKIFIDFDNSIARINNCSVIIFIKICIFNKAIIKLIHLRKTITIFL